MADELPQCIGCFADGDGGPPPGPPGEQVVGLLALMGDAGVARRTLCDKHREVYTTLAYTEPLGPSGEYPEGKLNKDDKGEMTAGLQVENGKVIVEFASDVKWFGMGPDETVAFATDLIKKAVEARTGREDAEITKPVSIEYQPGGRVRLTVGAEHTALEPKHAAYIAGELQAASEMAAVDPEKDAN